MRKSIIFFINYLNIYFMSWKDMFGEYLKDTNSPLYTEHENHAENGKYTAAYSKAFLHWFIKRCNEDLRNLYYSIINDNSRQASEYRDCLEQPPSIDWQVVPQNLNTILYEKKRVHMEPKQTYNDLASHTTDLIKFMEE